MNILAAFHSRYTTKVYDPSKELAMSYIEELKQIIHLSPSSINSQPWRFTFVIDPAEKAKFAEASFFNREKVLNCQALVVLARVENIEMYESWMRDTLPEGAVAYYDKNIAPLDDVLKREWFSRQLYLALGVLLSACATMEIDSTPMEGINLEEYSELLGNYDYKPQVAVALGFRDKDDFNQPDRTPKQRRAIDDVVKVL